MSKRMSASEKKNSLVKAAVKLSYQRGFNNATLADIAEEAGVPLGNVYYYFPTREKIGAAVLEAREDMFTNYEKELAQLDDPKQRLCSFVEMTMRMAGTVTQYGCPNGSLSYELLKQDDALATRSNRIFAATMGWMEAQFSEIGHKKDAPALALQLQASLQGASLLTQSFRDRAPLEKEGARLVAWIKSL